MNRTTIVFGLDGFDWNFFQSFVNAKNLPFINKCRTKGFFVSHDSVSPPITAPAWFSIATGQYPDKLGVIDFVYRRKAQDKNLCLVNSGIIRGQAIWDKLSREGYQVMVLNYPFLFPSYPINGLMLSGIGVPTQDDPRKLYPGNKYDLSSYNNLIEYNQEKYRDIENFFADLERFHKQQMQIFQKLVKENKADFIFIVFSSTDWVQHIAMKYVDSNHKKYEQKNHDQIISKYYRFWQTIDQSLEKLFNLVPGEKNVFITSDHGFGPQDQVFYLGSWLKKMGYLKLIQDKDQFQRRRNLYEFLAKYWKKYSKFFPYNLSNRLGARFRPVGGGENDNGKSKVQLLGHTNPFGAIYLNRFLINNPGKLKLELKKKLIKSGHDYGLDIHFFDNEFRKPYLNMLPDIAFVINGGRCVVSEKITEKVFEEETFSETHTGSHRKDGVFAGFGPDLARIGKKLEKVKIVDIAPTIMTLFGIEAGPKIDGGACFEIINPAILETKEKEQKTVTEC